jgi:hypothetical protein
MADNQQRMGREDHPAAQAAREGDNLHEEPSQINAAHGFKTQDAQRRKGTAEARGGNDHVQIDEKGSRGGV